MIVLARRRRPYVYIKVLSILIILAFQSHAQSQQRDKLASSMEHSMISEVLDKWYPQCIDHEYGGFITTYSYDFKAIGPQPKMIVTQARHTWVNAKAARLYPDKTYYLEGAKHGFTFLRDVMWDKKRGGFYTLVDRTGNVSQQYEKGKNAYGNAFAIYALAAYYEISHDTAALNLAQKTFLWLETHSHDQTYGGYYQHLEMDGTPVIRNKATPSMAETGYKDQNSSIHLLEAFTELYTVWPDSLLRVRLQEMLLLIRDKITTPKGYLTLFFTANWVPISYRDSSTTLLKKHHNLDHISFGHDVETAYLMLEASHALGIEHDTVTLTVAKRMIDHALNNGWDKKVGGFYDEGYYFKGNKSISIIKDTKNWWAQAEGMNTLLLMADYFPNDKMHYFEKFETLWHYISVYLIDHEHGGWYAGGLDKEPQLKQAPKGHVWKGTYHHFRAMSNCVTRLRNEHD